ncbi:Crp/Fnr family transcriptional regulator [Chryseobacterium sp. T16E-39]|uniref:Crp/Fnr family transcriptional regulator n=1 Tax=Chryseobacterium sp. T16E-39 TaxID=2015076 RepID=UPI000B5B2E59|nr:Crp/Fnr family transcriptional regulator [Chryseobacterium sp. T16E-39]ASK30888.1 Crp/Fnr family transcriptional regulator [Chryseobacterium sp. T16E-39]
MEDLSPFFENIKRKTHLSTENMERLTAAFQVVRIKRKQMIIQPGFVAKYRIYVLKGAFHSYVIDDKGNEHTIQFAVEDWWLSDYNSYIHQTPATQFVEALENSIILQIDHQAEQELKDANWELATLFRLMAEKSAAYLARRIVSNLTQSAEERYNDFVATYPKVVQRLPQYALASYLNMTREFLSKIRNDKVRKK